MKILVIDVGGSHVKLMLSGNDERRKFDSGKDFVPKDFVKQVLAQTSDWKYEAISIGFPAAIVDGKLVREPVNLPKEWFGFDFEAAFKKPVKVINDAAMQALGSYEGGRMLFLGLGTGLGSGMVLNNVVVSLELGQLRYSDEETLEERVGKHALKKLGATKWERAVHEVVAILQHGFIVDDVVIGGGNAKRLEKLPKGTRLGANENAFLGGMRMWGESPFSGNTKKHPLVIV
ncbi:MAG: polyphosphate glucokinase [Chthoniobacter sp.]|jgi:predicted NBD/HSP70 family sugar kinase|nr:polyphosphate glucokinase [Chthoniobacter sp.]